MNTTTKYFLYARKSSEGEDRQVTSIEDQISECKKLAEQLNIEIVDVISESKSAKEVGREGFNNMVKRIKKGEAQGILCWKLNRLARNPIDGGEIIDLLQKNTIGHVQTYGREYKPTDNVIIMYVEFGMSNQYSNDLSIDTKRGMRKKAERGWYPVSKLPIGYIHNYNKQKGGTEPEIINDPIRFPIVKKLWGLFLTGLYTVSDMKREADILGLVNVKGNPYSLSSFHYLFNNEFYCGYFYWKDERGNKVRHLGNHIPVVSSDKFHVAQSILGKHSKPTRERTYTFPFRGLIRCGECEGFVTAEHKLQAICTECKHKFSIKTKKVCPKCTTHFDTMNNPSMVDKTYYHCNKKTTKSCSQRSVTQEQIETFIIKNLEDISINKEFASFAIRALQKINEQTHEEKSVTIHLKKRKTELEKRINNLIHLRVDGEITKEQLENMQESSYKEIKLLEAKISATQHIQRNWLNRNPSANYIYD